MPSPTSRPLRIHPHPETLPSPSLANFETSTASPRYSARDRHSAPLKIPLHAWKTDTAASQLFSKSLSMLDCFAVHLNAAARIYRGRFCTRRMTAKFPPQFLCDEKRSKSHSRMVARSPRTLVSHERPRTSLPMCRSCVDHVSIMGRSWVDDVSAVRRPCATQRPHDLSLAAVSISRTYRERIENASRTHRVPIESTSTASAAPQSRYFNPDTSRGMLCNSRRLQPSQI